MTQLDPIVIIGSGQAGVTLARELHKKSANRPVMLITQDAGGFYSKPMLSNALAKKMPLERLHIQNATTFAEKTHTEVKAYTQVTHIDPDNKIISTQSVEDSHKVHQIRYNTLILATGGTAFAPPIPGIEFTLSINHLNDYYQLRQKLAALPAEKPAKIIVIGGGLIGCELANDLISSHAQVTIIERENQLLPRVASPHVSHQLSTNFKTIGIQCLTSCTVQNIFPPSINTDTTTKNTDTQSYTVRFLTTLKNSTPTQSAAKETHQTTVDLEADIVISALGLKASTRLAQQAGLKTNNGIQCNRLMQTSHQHIFAIGDCVEIEGLVLPYILPIMEAAKALAATLTGETTKVHYPCMPIAVKTTAYPLVVCPPRQMSDAIRIENTTQGTGLKTIFYREQDIVGFSLGGTAISERQALTSQTLGLFEQ